MRESRQHSASLEQDDARQKHLAMEVDVPAYKTACKRTEDAATLQAKHGNCCSANQVDADQICLTSFGDDSTGPPALPCTRDDTLVDNSATAPKLCLSSAKMRMRTTAGGILHASPTSTATMMIFH